MATLTTPIPQAELQAAPRPVPVRLWDFFTKPSALIQQPDKRQQARFISALLLFIVAVVAVLTFNPIFIVPTTAPILRLEFTFLLLIPLGIYILSRTKHAELAMNLLAVTSLANTFVIYLSNPNPTTLYYLVVGVLFVGILLPTRTANILIGLTVIGVEMILHLSGSPVDSAPITFVVMFSGVVLIFARFRNLLETTRQNQITEALGEVETLNETLSQTNQELTRASALAKESARLKSEFMATMSHELRTPLNAMLGFSGILLEGIGGEFDDDTRHMVERIDQNSKRLLTLINDVLDIAKIESGRLELVITPINPQKLVDTWRAQLGVLAQQKHLEFITEIDPALPHQLYGDSERISQVVINLLSNAFKFTETGSVKLALKSKDDSWLIEVTDTGVGIPPHAINYIFDEFRQLDGSSKRAYGGTGLGLAIVRNLCRMMDGSVAVNSKLGEGSTFIVTLPLKSVPA